MNNAVLEALESSTAFDEKRPTILRSSNRFYDILNELKNRFSLLFDTKANDIAESMCRRTEKISKNNVYMSLKDISKNFTLSNPQLNKPVRTALANSIAENVKLIKSLPQDHFARLTEHITKAITEGNGQQDILKVVQEAAKDVAGMTDRRVNNLAADQTRKAYNAMNKERLNNLGVKKFEWIHTGGSREPREYHMNRYPTGLNGGIFTFDDPPIIDEKTGETGLPGDAYNCRCRMRPIVEFNNDE